MRIGILSTFVGNFGKPGFYNVQEIGLARELSKLVDELILYKAIPAGEPRSEGTVPGCGNTVFYQIPTQATGINGKWDASIMDPTLDAILYFSDTQLAVPSIDQWCRKNQVKLYPYIGVVESHSTNAIIKTVINFLFSRNVKVYKQCKCFVKNPDVARRLNEKGVKNTVVAPVGIDLSLLHENYETADPDALKVKWGFSPSDKVLLFIGRMTEEKQPLRMIELFKELSGKEKRYKLLMIGKGELLDAAKQAAQGADVRFVEQVPNRDMWELYRIADAFVNLNQQEIFGMAILEAMYYECKVVAWKAPGPSFIIGEDKYGSLCESNAEILSAIVKNGIDPAAAHARIINSFTWESAAKLIYREIS